MSIEDFTAEELYAFQEQALEKAASLYSEGTIHPPLKEDEFLMTDICERLNISKPTAQTRIDEMIENGDVVFSRRASVANRDGHLRTKIRVFRWAYGNTHRAA
jgi:DNA-binding MarR family transcriptional regulator